MTNELCKTCEGTGKEKIHNVRDYEIVKCRSCNGTGRVQSYSRSFSIQIPYGMDNSILYNADSKLFALWRELETEIRGMCANHLKNTADE